MGELLSLLVVGLLAWRYFSRPTWRDLPTLSKYLDAFPRCRTPHGIKCRVCNSGSIRNWGWRSADDVRRLFISNHCGQILYRNELDRETART